MKITDGYRNFRCFGQTKENQIYIRKSKLLAQNFRKIWEQDAPDTGVIRYVE